MQIDVSTYCNIHKYFVPFEILSRFKFQAKQTLCKKVGLKAAKLIYSCILCGTLQRIKDEEILL